MKKIICVLLLSVLILSSCSKKIERDYENYTYCYVEGSSMAPTINAFIIMDGVENNGNNIAILDERDKNVKTGDIIAVKAENSDKPLVKRVIATGGQKITIDFSKWEVRVDGVILDESSYLIKDVNYFPEVAMFRGSFLTDIAEITVESGKLFVMGDNRQASIDSRRDVIGQLKAEDVIGKVTGIITDPTSEDKAHVSSMILQS